jgi:hypothetical protein
MARARNIKPGFFKNEELVEVPFETRLLFIGLWTLADREGRLEDRPKRIKMEVFPVDSVDIDKCLNELQSHGFILRYSVDGVGYIQVLAFNKHQNPHKTERDSTIPPPALNGSPTVNAPLEHDANRAESLFTDSPNEDSPTQGADAPGVVDPPSPNPPRYTSDFETFWKAYPTGHGVKKQAFDAWRKIPAADRQSVMDGLEAWKVCDRWQRGFVKDAQRWLRDRQWDDDPPAAPPNVMTVHQGGAPNPNKRGGYTAGELIQMAREEYARESS